MRKFKRLVFALVVCLLTPLMVFVDCRWYKKPLLIICMIIDFISLPFRVFVVFKDTSVCCNTFKTTIDFCKESAEFYGIVWRA